MFEVGLLRHTPAYDVRPDRPGMLPFKRRSALAVHHRVVFRTGEAGGSSCLPILDRNLGLRLNQPVIAVFGGPFNSNRVALRLGIPAILIADPAHVRTAP